MIVDKPIDQLSIKQIQAKLRNMGYPVYIAAEVKRAASIGCLIWTNKRLTTIDRSQINMYPTIV